jgi:hypothetical protein
MKKIFLIILILAILSGGVLFFVKQKSASPSASQCQVKKITYYYLDNCPWCQKIKSEGTLDKIEALGIKINKINAAIGQFFTRLLAFPLLSSMAKLHWLQSI